ncbi:MAG: acyl-ACP--UDP-N-acetylglucosamine O-acyltransferase [Dehalococcoidia bacterium]
MVGTIHPSAIVETGAHIEDGVSIGAFAYIESSVRIGAGTAVLHHASVVGNTEIGCECEIYPYAFIGARCQDQKFSGGSPGVRIGDRNVLREYTTIHAATADGDYTVLGNDGLLCAYSHIAHDCEVGDFLIMSSHAALAGHVILEDRVNIGWNAGVHQFCRVGALAMVSACSKLVQDVPPFMTCAGNPAAVRMINRIGLQRAGFSEESITLARQVFKTLYREGLNRRQAVKKMLRHEASDAPVIKAVVAFIDGSERGLA